MTNKIIPYEKSFASHEKAQFWSDKNELKQEVLRQLRISFPELSDPSFVIINPKVNKIDNKWIEPDTAFIQTYNNKPLSAFSDVTKNLYQVGTQNGNSNYSFTTMESAVTNSIVFANRIEPETLKIDGNVRATDVTPVLVIVNGFVPLTLMPDPALAEISPEFVHVTVPFAD